jgi:hypothetical protein
MKGSVRHYRNLKTGKHVTVQTGTIAQQRLDSSPDWERTIPPKSRPKVV